MYLFVCSQSLLRSRTAELLCVLGGVSARSCGTSSDAEAPVSDNLLKNADRVFCMETHHRLMLGGFAHFGAVPIHVLDIPDEFFRFDEALVYRLQEAVNRHAPDVAAALRSGYASFKNMPEAARKALSDGCARPAKQATPEIRQRYGAVFPAPPR